jgi:hypothetical protein
MLGFMFRVKVKVRVVEVQFHTLQWMPVPAVRTAFNVATQFGSLPSGGFLGLGLELGFETKKRTNFKGTRGASHLA